MLGIGRVSVGHGSGQSCNNVVYRLVKGWTNVGSTSGQLRKGCMKGWLKIGPTLAQHNMANIGPTLEPTAKTTLDQCCIPTLAQPSVRYWANVGPTELCYLG